MIIDWADHTTTDEIYLIPNQMLIVKYSYKANDESPLGEPELSVEQKESAAFICYHHDNNLWSKIRRNDGQEGYIPTSYIMVFVFDCTVSMGLYKDMKSLRYDQHLLTICKC
jgi:hypothetical protein